MNPDDNEPVDDVPEPEDEPEPPEEPDIPEPPEPKSDEQSAEADEKYLRAIERGPSPVGKIVLVISIIFVVIVLGVGGVMWWKFMQRYRGLNACKTEQMDGDDMKPGFAPCVRDVLSGSRYDDVKIEAISLLLLAEDGDSIPVLVELAKGKGDVMRMAVKAIGELGGEEARKASEPLAALLPTAGPRDKVIIAWTLAKLGDERAFTPLLDGYLDGYTGELDGWEDEFLIDFAASDPKALDEMIKLVDSKDAGQRWFAASTLGKMKDPRVVEPLLRLMDDPNKNVVKVAAISLGMTGDERAGDAIIKVMSTYPEMVDELLRSIQQTVGAPGLMLVYKRVDKPGQKSRIVTLMREIRDPRSGDLLMAMLDDVVKETEGKGPTAGIQTRKEIALALSDLGDPRAVPLLKYFIELNDLKVACKLYDCGGANIDALDAETVENYMRGYRMSPVLRDMINGLVNVDTPEAKQIVLDLWQKTLDANAKYGMADSYLYWPTRPALIMSALGRMGSTDAGPLIAGQVCSNAEVNMRAKALNVGKTQDLTEPCPDIGAGARALGRLKYAPAKETVMAIVKRPEGIDFSVPNVDNESFFMDRKAVLQGLAFYGDPAAFESIVTIIEDPLDDFRTREDAVYPLAYCIDSTNRDTVIEKVVSGSTDGPVRVLYANALKLQTDAQTAQKIAPLLAEGTPNALLIPLAKIVGDSCDETALDLLVEAVTRGGQQDPTSLADYQNAAIFAITLCGSEKQLMTILPYLNQLNTQDVVRSHYEEHPFYLTNSMFESGRALKKLRAARWLKKHDMIWAWQYLTGRLDVGFEDAPDGLSKLQILQTLSLIIRNGQPWEQEIAAWALLDTKARGYVLAVAAEGGAPAKVVRDVLRVADRG